MSAAPDANPISLEADASLLTSFVNGGLQSALDDHPHLSARDILAWFNDPQTQTDLAKLKDLARAAATLRHSLARFNAIARLDDLCLNSQNESEARRAAIALLSPRRHRPAAKLNTSPTADLPDPQPPISPPPDTRPQAKAPAPSRSEISNSKSPIPSPPASQIPDLKSPTPVSPKHTDPADSSSFRSEITDLKFSPPPAPPPAPSTPSLSQRLHDLRAALAASPEDGPFDDALADQVISFWKDLGVPPSHPDIIDALAEGRMDDLPEIADRILAGAPP